MASTTPMEDLMRDKVGTLRHHIPYILYPLALQPPAEPYTNTLIYTAHPGIHPLHPRHPQRLPQARPPRAHARRGLERDTLPVRKPPIASVIYTTLESSNCTP
jgi:hypothetical protein